MEIGFVGLGRMGLNMTRRLLRGGHRIVAHDRGAAPLADARAAGAQVAQDLEGLVAATGAPRAIWAMIPAGAPLDELLAGLEPRLAPGDLMIDGGNSNY